MLETPDFTEEDQLALEHMNLLSDLNNIDSLYLDVYYEPEGNEGCQRVQEWEARTKARIQEIERRLAELAQ